MYCTYIAPFHLKRHHALHSFSHTNTLIEMNLSFKVLALTIRSKLRFTILLKDTSTHAQKESEMQPPTLRLVDTWLYLLSQSLLVVAQTVQC